MNNNKKKLAIIGTVGLPAKYGGFETLTSHLVDHLTDQYDMTVYCSGKQYPKSTRIKKYKGADLKYLPLEANGVQSIPYDTWSILHSLWYADVLLILGVAGAWILPFVRFFTNKKIIISIDGIEWKRDKWSWAAKLYLYWAEKIAVKFSHSDISDNESIQDYTAMRYGSLSNVIEYGADHTLVVFPEEDDIKKYPFLAKPYAFKVCRIEPENNIEMILESFISFTKFPLILVGNWDKSSYGKNLKSKYKNCNNLILLDPIYDQREIDLLRGNCTVYVHGHSAGGTNPSLVEAMYLGLPVIANGVNYNRTTTEGKALYFDSKEDLIDILNHLDVKQTFEMGYLMHEIANRRYKWSIIANKYNDLIKKACTIKEKEEVRPILQSYNKEVLNDLAIGHLANHNLFFEK